MNQFNESNSEICGPVVCHCSAGIGRTAVFIAIASSIEIIDSLRKNIDQISRNLLNEKINIPNFVEKLRMQREGSVQNWKQFSFIYKTINFYLNSLSI